MIPLKKVTEKKIPRIWKNPVLKSWTGSRKGNRGCVNNPERIFGREKTIPQKRSPKWIRWKRILKKNPAEDSKMCKESWKEPSEIGQKSRNPELMETDPDGMPGMLKICRRIISKWLRIAKRFELSPRILKNPCGSLKIRELGQNMCNNLQGILKNPLKHHSKSWKIPRILKDP